MRNSEFVIINQYSYTIGQCVVHLGKNLVKVMKRSLSLLCNNKGQTLKPKPWPLATLNMNLMPSHTFTLSGVNRHVIILLRILFTVYCCNSIYGDLIFFPRPPTRDRGWGWGRTESFSVGTERVLRETN